MTIFYRIDLRYKPDGDVLYHYHDNPGIKNSASVLDVFCIEEEYAKYFTAESTAKGVLTRLTKKFGGIADGSFIRFDHVLASIRFHVPVYVSVEKVPYRYHFRDLSFPYDSARDIVRPYRYFPVTSVVKYEYGQYAIDRERGYTADSKFVVKEFHPPIYHDCDDYGMVIATDGSVHSAANLIYAD